MAVSAQYQLQNMPQWLSQMYEDLARRSYAHMQTPYAPYRTPGGADIPRIAGWQPAAGLAPHLTRAHQLAGQEGIATPFIQQAGQLANQAMETFPQGRAAYENPYTQQVTDRIAQDAQRQFAQHTLPSMQHYFAGQGHPGSSRHRQLAQEAARDMQDRVLAAQTQARHQGFETSGRLHASDMARMLAGAGLQRELGASALGASTADIERLRQMGLMEQGQRQANLTQGYEDWMQQRGAPTRQMQEQMGIMSGIHAPVSTYQAQQTPQPYQWNRAGNLGNLAAGLYGMRQGMRQGYKKGGAVKSFPKFPKLPKPQKLGVKTGRKPKKLGTQPLAQSSFVRHPKVGGKHSMKKGIF